MAAQHDAPPPFPSTPVRLVPYSQSWHIAKIILRGMSIAICLVSFGLLGYQGNRTFMWGRISDTTICLAPLLLAFLWDIAELVTIFRRRDKRRGIHPGAVVAADLLLWGLMVAAIALLARNVSLGVYWSYDENAYIHQNVEIGLLTMVVLLFGLHFTLFVRACKETDERNKTREKRYMVYIPGGGSPFSIEETPYGQASSTIEEPPRTYRAQAVQDDIEDPVYNHPALKKQISQKEIIPSKERYMI